MIFNAEKYTIEDKPMFPFIDEREIEVILENAKPNQVLVEEIINKALTKNRLSLEETAVLLKADDAKSIEMIMNGAKLLKQQIYGNRIVLFAPLYVGNYCSNDCKYCGFRVANKDAIRKTLSSDELINNVKALEDKGHKRIILVFGEHQKYSPEYIAQTIKTVYDVKKGNGEIRRININAAPLDIEGFKTIAASGIGTYQVFQETYHRQTYSHNHLSGKKADYDYRLTSLDRAFAAGIDDVGIGVLFGLFDWKFEVMGLIRHVNHLESCFNVGPHTISFPRLQKASHLDSEGKYLVSDEEFVRIIAILRLAVPYTGLILTARESATVRNEVLKYGCSQLDAGTKIELGAYAENQKQNQDLNKEQFQINDNRSLNEVMDELITNGYLPSFCTACYRKGRTGEHFMEFSVPGFVKKFCTSNAIMTLAEYLIDYAPEQTAKAGWDLIKKNINDMDDSRVKSELRSRLMKIHNGERDQYF